MTGTYDRGPDHLHNVESLIGVAPVVSDVIFDLVEIADWRGIELPVGIKVTIHQGVLSFLQFRQFSCQRLPQNCFTGRIASSVNHPLPAMQGQSGDMRQQRYEFRIIAADPSFALL